VKEIGCEALDWIEQVQNKGQWSAVMTTAMKIRIFKKTEIVLTMTWATVRFLRSLINGVVMNAAAPFRIVEYWYAVISMCKFLQP
jgi:hypothetical protein